MCVAFITMDDILNIMGVSGIESPAPDCQLWPSQLVSGSDSGVTWSEAPWLAPLLSCVTSHGPVTMAGSGQLRLEASDKEQARLDSEWAGEYEEEHEECEEQGEEQRQGG